MQYPFASRPGSSQLVLMVVMVQGLAVAAAHRGRQHHNWPSMLQHNCVLTNNRSGKKVEQIG
jgi:hypothetical protein